MTIRYVPTFPENPSNPARCNRRTGVITINSRVWAKLSPLARRYWLAHELGHIALNTGSETAADNYAFARVAGTEQQSLKQIRKTMSNILTNNLQGRARMEANAINSLQFAAKRGSHMAAALLQRNGVEVDSTNNANGTTALTVQPATIEAAELRTASTRARAKDAEAHYKAKQQAYIAANNGGTPSARAVAEQNFRIAKQQHLMLQQECAVAETAEMNLKQRYRRELKAVAGEQAAIARQLDWQAQAEVRAVQATEAAKAAAERDAVKQAEALDAHHLRTNDGFDTQAVKKGQINDQIGTVKQSDTTLKAGTLDIDTTGDTGIDIANVTETHTENLIPNFTGATALTTAGQGTTTATATTDNGGNLASRTGRTTVSRTNATSKRSLVLWVFALLVAVILYRKFIQKNKI